MNVREKPFSTYKWRWLSVQPTEGLLKAPIFLGVLRALKENEGEPYSSYNLYQDLQKVDADTEKLRGKLVLARGTERNLFRNSGQYWRGTGLLREERGIISLSGFGQRVASGDITINEFVDLMIRNTVLPNPKTYSKSEIEKWKTAGLRIKPFKLILSIMSFLGRNYGEENAFLSPNELIRVVIPLAGIKVESERISLLVYRYRTRDLDVSSWVDCAMDANDKRLAKEFLLFLMNFGVCIGGDDSKNVYDQKFYFNQDANVIFDKRDDSLIENDSLFEEELNITQDSEIPKIIERNKVLVSVTKRSGQSKFRKAVFSAANNTCILTRENLTDVLEAAHIIPVSDGGTDLTDNGFCMRVDIHRLFDNGKIKILPSGQVVVSNILKESFSYNNLPKKINLPTAVSIANVDWRSKYL